jgi:hypothetical protein
VCESCGLVGHVMRKYQNCKYSTNEKSKFYVKLPREVETVESENNKHDSEQYGEF